MSGSPWLSDGVPFLGRSVGIGSKYAHLWGASATPAATQANLLNNVQGDIFVPVCDSPGGLFQITTTAREFQRNSGEGNLLPLSDQAVGNPPAGTDPPTSRTQVAIRIIANDGTSQRQFDMDANQSICVVAHSVCVWWLAPLDTRDVQNWNDTQRLTVRRTGFVFDAYIAAAVSRIEAPPGDNSSVLLTQYLVSAAGTTPSIPIPNYAKAVTIYQASTAGVSSVAWTQWLGDPNGAAGSIEIGALPFLPGLRKTQPNSELGHATHLRADIDPNTARLFTLVWTIRP